MEEKMKFSLEEIIASVQAFLPSNEVIDKKENLIKQGIESLAIMRIVNEYRKKGSSVKFAELIEEPYLENWYKEINKIRKDRRSNKQNSKKRYEPYELTPVQFSYFIGRGDEQELGGIDCHAYLELGGKRIDKDRLNDAYKKLQLHHPMLHTKYLYNGQQQEIKDYVPRELKIFEVENELEFFELRDSLSHRKLDIENAETFEIMLVEFPNGEQKLIYDVSLIIADVISFQKIMEDLCKLYNEEELPRETAEFSFKEYLKNNLISDKIEDEKYWADKVKNMPDNPQIPLKKHPADISNVVFSTRSYKISPYIWNNIKSKALSESVTPAMVLLTVYAAVLDRWSESEKFNINMPIFNRNTYEPWMEDVIADFSNTLIFDVDFSKNESFISTVKKNQRHFHERIKHSNYSGVSVVRDMKKYNKSSNVVFAYNVGQPIISEDVISTLGNLEYMISQTPQVWIDFQVFNLQDDGLFIKWDSVEELFPDGMLDEMFGCLKDYIKLLGTEESSWNSGMVFEKLEEKVKKLPYLNFEKREVEPLTLVDDFLKNAETKPDNIAIVDGENGNKITYAELKEKAMKMAFLLESSGVKERDLVTITLNRGVSQIVGTLGILIAGAGYVPVGTNQPLKRAETIYKRGNIKYVVTSRTLVDKIEFPKDVKIIYTEDIQICKSIDKSKAKSDYTAYVIFTSGSTGEPKGVVIKHANACNTIVDINSRYKISERDRTIAISALDFDLSVYDIFGMLMVGGGIVTIADDMNRDPGSWKVLLEKHNVTIWNSVPAIMNMLLMWNESNEAIGENKIRLALLSGDWIPIDLPAKFYSIFTDANLISLGGATEASIWSNYFEVSLPLQEDWNSIPYGYPLTNQLFKIIDKRGRSCPINVKGELIIEGEGIADGYLNHIEKTKEAFFIDENVPAYRTGDLGKFRENAVIEFLGRKDLQVKVNGYRIELSEIEHVLKTDNSVEEAVCVLGENEKIYAYVTPKTVGKNKNSVDILPNTEIENTLLDSDNFFKGCNNIEEAKRLLKNSYRKINCQARKFIKKLIMESDIDRDLIVESYKSYYDLLYKSVNEESYEDEFVNDDEIYDALSQSIPKIREVLYGKIDVTEMLTSPGNKFTTSFLSEIIPLNKFKYGIIGNVILKQFMKSQDKLKIGVFATRQGDLLQYLDNILSDKNCEIHYLDSSLYYFNREVAKLKNIDINYKSFSINDDISGSDLFRYDILISDNYLHRSYELDSSIKKMKSLLRDEGIALLIEQNCNTPLVLSIAGLYDEGFGHLRDRQLPLLSIGEWSDKLETQFNITNLMDKELMDLTETCIFALIGKNKIAIPDIESLMFTVKSKLPSYMVPKMIMVLSEIPYTDNGKVNRKRLSLNLSKHNQSSGKELIYPENETEEKILKCFEEVLKLDNVSVADEFFSLGGDSLLAISLMNTIKENTDLDITLPQIFTLQTVKNIAEAIGKAKENNDDMETGEI